MTTKSIRLDSDLIAQAQAIAAVQHRSIAHQIEHWMTLGRIVSSKINIDDVYAITQGLKRLRVEPVQSAPVDSKAVFEKLEADRASGFAGKPVTSAPFYFEASKTKPGLLDKVNSQTGERETGRFANGRFREFNGQG